jgi:hypothetical protein
MLTQHANSGSGFDVAFGKSVDSGECGEIYHSIWMLCTDNSRESGVVNGMQEKKTMSR